jgi:protein-tyrosine phosphatase
LIDTHSHLLPGIDDGADSLEQSLAMARHAVDTGVRAVVCTPHLREPGERAAAAAAPALRGLRGALDEERLPLELYLGYELSFSFVNSVSPAELEKYCLGGSATRHLLLEVPHDHWPALADQVVHRLRLHGLTPVLAHPERNPRMQADPRLLARLLDLGAVAQGTVASLLGLFGRSAHRCLIQQLSRGEVSLLASDAHYRRRGTWSLADVADGLEQQLPGIDLDLLIARNPAALLQGGPLEPARPVATRGGRRWLGLLGRTKS